MPPSTPFPHPKRLKTYLNIQKLVHFIHVYANFSGEYDVLDEFIHLAPHTIFL